MGKVIAVFAIVLVSFLAGMSASDRSVGVETAGEARVVRTALPNLRPAFSYSKPIRDEWSYVGGCYNFVDYDPGISTVLGYSAWQTEDDSQSFTELLTGIPVHTGGAKEVIARMPEELQEYFAHIQTGPELVLGVHAEHVHPFSRHSFVRSVTVIDKQHGRILIFARIEGVDLVKFKDQIGVSPSALQGDHVPRDGRVRFVHLNEVIQ